jgi:hypothetical protein
VREAGQVRLQPRWLLLATLAAIVAGVTIAVWVYSAAVSP